MEVTAKKSLAQPHNCYNIFFILERQKLIQAIKDSSDGTAARVSEEHVAASSVDLGGYDSLSLPDLPQRYKCLTLENGWYVPGKNANRKHVKTHGLTSFADMARTVASNWKAADGETKKYCNAVARIIKERHATLLLAGGMGGAAKKGPKKRSRAVSKKKQHRPQNGRRRASDPPMPSDMAMANIPNRGNLHLSSSICGGPSASVSYGGIIHPNTFSVTPEQQAFYNYLVSMNNNQESMRRSSSMADLPSTFDLAVGPEFPKSRFGNGADEFDKMFSDEWNRSSAPMEHGSMRFRRETLPRTSFEAKRNFGDRGRGRSNNAGSPRRRTSEPVPLDRQFFARDGVDIDPAPVPHNPENDPQEIGGGSGGNERTSRSDLSAFCDASFDLVSARSALRPVSRPGTERRRATLDSAIAPSLAELAGRANGGTEGGTIRPAEKINLAVGLELPSDPVASLAGEPDIARSTLPHRDMSTFHGDETIQEVDISDSDIRNMWWSDGV